MTLATLQATGDQAGGEQEQLNRVKEHLNWGQGVFWEHRTDLVIEWNLILMEASPIDMPQTTRSPKHHHRQR